VLTIS